MADVLLTCPACGRAHTVSEYVEGPAFPCRHCGQPIPLSPRAESGGLTVRRRPPAPAAPAPAPLAPAMRSEVSAREARRARVGEWKVASAWLLFLGVGGTLVYLRVFGGCPGLNPAALRAAGMLALAAAYLLAIGLALRDNMFDGLLCLVVPFYPFYYLFFTCRSLWIRALTGALMAAFGYDALLWIQRHAIRLADAVDAWIRAG